MSSVSSLSSTSKRRRPPHRWRSRDCSLLSSLTFSCSTYGSSTSLFPSAFDAVCTPEESSSSLSDSPLHSISTAWACGSLVTIHRHSRQIRDGTHAFAPSSDLTSPSIGSFLACEMGVVTCLTFWNPPREMSPSSRRELGLLVGTSGRTPSVALWIWEKASPSNARCVSALDHSPLSISDKSVTLSSISCSPSQTRVAFVEGNRGRGRLSIAAMEGDGIHFIDSKDIDNHDDSCFACLLVDDVHLATLEAHTMKIWMLQFDTELTGVNQISSSTLGGTTFSALDGFPSLSAFGCLLDEHVFVFVSANGPPLMMLESQHLGILHCISSSVDDQVLVCTGDRHVLFYDEQLSEQNHSIQLPDYLFPWNDCRVTRLKSLLSDYLALLLEDGSIMFANPEQRAVSRLSSGVERDLRLVSHSECNQQKIRIAMHSHSSGALVLCLIDRSIGFESLSMRTICWIESLSSLSIHPSYPIFLLLDTRSVFLLSEKSGGILGSLDLDGEGVSLTVSPSGRYLAVIHSTGELQLCLVETSTSLRNIATIQPSTGIALLTPLNCGQAVIMESGSHPFGRVSVFWTCTDSTLAYAEINLMDGSIVSNECYSTDSRIISLMLHPSGRSVASFTANGSILLFDLPEKAKTPFPPLLSWEKHASLSESVSFGSLTMDPTGLYAFYASSSSTSPIYSIIATEVGTGISSVIFPEGLSGVSTIRYISSSRYDSGKEDVQNNDSDLENDYLLVISAHGYFARVPIPDSILQNIHSLDCSSASRISFVQRWRDAFDLCSKTNSSSHLQRMYERHQEHLRDRLEDNLRSWTSVLMHSNDAIDSDTLDTKASEEDDPLRDPSLRLECEMLDPDGKLQSTSASLPFSGNASPADSLPSHPYHQSPKPPNPNSFRVVFDWKDSVPDSLSPLHRSDPDHLQLRKSKLSEEQHSTLSRSQSSPLWLPERFREASPSWTFPFSNPPQSMVSPRLRESVGPGEALKVCDEIDEFEARLFVHQELVHEIVDRIFDSMPSPGVSGSTSGQLSIENQNDIENSENVHLQESSSPRADENPVDGPSVSLGDSEPRTDFVVEEDLVPDTVAADPESLDANKDESSQGQNESSSET